MTAADAMGQKGKTVTRTVRAPRIPMPKPPAGLEIHRSAHRRVVISWLASNASRYGVAVELSNGRKIALSRRIHCRQLVIRRVSPKTKVVAKVFGVRVDGAPGRSIVASLGSKQAVRGVGRRIRGPQC